MKILTLSDVDNALNIGIEPVHMIMNKINSNDINMIMFAGDINQKDIEEFFNLLTEKLPNKPIVWVLGNHDFELEWLDEIKKSGRSPFSSMSATEHERKEKIKENREFQKKVIEKSIKHLTEKYKNLNIIYPFGLVIIDNIIIYGISSGECLWWKEELNNELLKLQKSPKNKKYKHILLTHEPPFGILDSTRVAMDKDEKGNHTEHIGEELILLFAKNWKPDFHIFGHVHNSGQRKKLIEETWFVNTSSVQRESQKEPKIYTGVYGIIDTDKRSIELRCLNSRTIKCEKCGEIAYIPYFWKRDKCSNCYKNSSKTIDEITFEKYKNKIGTIITENNDGTTSITYTEKIEGLGIVTTTETLNLRKKSKSKENSKHPSIFDF